jgi:hypothetical protein
MLRVAAEPTLAVAVLQWLEGSCCPAQQRQLQWQQQQRMQWQLLVLVL